MFCLPGEAWIQGAGICGSGHQIVEVTPSTKISNNLMY